MASIAFMRTLSGDRVFFLLPVFNEVAKEISLTFGDRLGYDKKSSIKVSSSGRM